MHNLKMSVKQIYNEREASEALGIALPLLHVILDAHIFNDGTPRPENVEFTSADLLMIAYWVEKTPMENVLCNAVEKLNLNRAGVHCSRRFGKPSSRSLPLP